MIDDNGSEGADRAATTPKAVLVLEKNPARRRRVKSVLAAAFPGIAIESQLPSDLAEQDLDLMVIDIDELGDDERARLWALLESRTIRWPVLLHSGATAAVEIAELVEKGHVCNIIARREPLEAEELLTTVGKLVHEDIFGIEKYFSWGSRRLSMEITSSDEKMMVMAACETFAAQSGAASRFAAAFIAVTDELLTNALFNAPVTTGGERPFHNMHRARSVTLADGDFVKITLCFDGDRLGVSATDPYGSLSAERLLKSVAARLRSDYHEVRSNTGGAGVGLSQTFESVSHLVLNLAPGIKTEVIGMIDIRGSYRDFMLAPKSLNVFQKKP